MDVGADVVAGRKGDRALTLLSLVLGLGLILAAVGRQRSLEPLSPTDLAFYHQATWSAAQGLGFAQTVLGFDGSSLLGSLHLDLLRAAFVPVYWLFPSVYTLLILQAFGVVLGAFALRGLGRCVGLSSTALALLLLGYALHPLTLELATVDVRPIVWMVPGVLLMAWSLHGGPLAALLVGGIITLTAREEGIWAVLALLPHALLLGWQARARGQASGGASSPHRPVGPSVWHRAIILFILFISGIVLLLVSWGKLSQLSATAQWQPLLNEILAGTRPLFRSEQELSFAVRSLLPLSVGLLAPELLFPALAGWGILTIFSGFEGVAEGGRGIHYLAIVHPLLWSAVVVGLGRLGKKGALPVTALVVIFSVATGLSSLELRSRWAWAAVVGPGDAVQGFTEVLEPVLRSPGGVLTEPTVAGLLANRSHLFVTGEAQLEPSLIAQRLNDVEWVVLDAREFSAEEASSEGLNEQQLWRKACQARGFGKVGEGFGREVWRKAGSQ